MSITEELIAEIYDKADLYFTNRFGSSPQRIEIGGDGKIIGVWENYCCGSRESEYEYMKAEDLEKTTDEVLEEARLEAERKHREEKERKAKEAREKEARQKEQRRKDYLALKDEFEI